MNKQTTFADYLKTSLKEKSLTLEQGSLLMGRSHNYLHVVIKTGNPSLKTLLAIQKILNIHLITWNEPKHVVKHDIEAVKKKLFKYHKERRKRKI